jgi:hypothetical protein
LTKAVALNVVALLWIQVQSAQRPPLLEQALKAMPDVRLLVPATDLRQYTQEDLQKFGYWPPWLVQDFDRDKRPDVAAVVVKPSPTGLEFGVIAVHARTPNEVHWVVEPDADPINGVAKGPASDTIVPLFCVECDSNIWLRWSGEEYEAELHAVGETIDVGSDAEAAIPLYSSPNLGSKLVATVSHCTIVVVRKVGGTPDKRWYFVETPEGQRGWVSDVAANAACVG